MPEKMSTSSQNNGKRSSNSSIVNTPSSTPLTNTVNGNATVNNLQNSPPPNNNAPKYGTLVPNRIFVGGISANTTEGELMQLFSNYGTVKAAKIIQDRAGVSKGYGFITFESEDDAKRPLREAENIVLRERKLNIAPAIKKQPFNRAFDASSPPAVAAGNATQFFFPPGAPVPYFQGGVAYYPQPAPPGPGDPNAQTPVYQTPSVYPGPAGPPQAATYPSMMFPTQTIYMPQQYPLPMPYDYNYFQNNGATGPTPQYVVGNQGVPGGTPCTSMPSSSSPTRPCYNQQLSVYNPTDSMFYNLPVYSTTIEGPPIYPEAFDLSPAGPFAEESYNGVAESLIAPQEIDMSINSTTQVAPITEAGTTSNSQHPNAPVTVTINSNNTPKPTRNDDYIYDDASSGRNSSTPVVSLLSLDQQQEKDLLSLQGGRRRKPSNPPSSLGSPTPPRNYSSNVYNPYSPIAYHSLQSQPFNTYNTNFTHNRLTYTGYQRRLIGFDNRCNNHKTKKRIFDGNKTIHSNDHSSRSSLRTDSNSSASCIDENKNEEKTHIRTAVNTPPPAPYSPLANPFKMFNLTNLPTTNSSFRNSNNPNYNHIRPNYHSNNNNYNNEKIRVINDTSNVNKTGGTNSSNNSTHNLTSNLQQTLYSQVHVATSQALVSTPSVQGFNGAPTSARRNRRSLRRSAGTGVNEIGAGDAPLLSEVGGEVCKKLETLKL